MANLSIAQLVALAQSVGFPDPATAAAIAMAESGGNPAAVANTTGQTNLPAGTTQENSIGLWQINTLAHPTYNATQLTDPTYNAQAAFAISSSGTNFSPWSTFTSGAYQQYLAAAQAAAGQLPMQQILSAAFIVAGGAGVWWLIEHGYLDDALAGAKRLVTRARALRA